MTDFTVIFGKAAEEPSVVSIGSFDGVHGGHLEVLNLMKEVASEAEITTTIATFDPHPRAVLGGPETKSLTSLEERGDLLKGHGIDRFISIPFTRSLANTSPEVFVEKYMIKGLRASAIVVGHDHRFGKGRKGDVSLLRAIGKHKGFSVHQLDPVLQLDEVISSSLIRNKLSDGRVEEASQLLGRPYNFSGIVIRGDGRGKQIGFPTANLAISSSQRLIPSSGVYAVYVRIPGLPGLHPSMMNIGTRPTFDGTGLHLEVYILDWNGDLYDRELRVEFVKRLRNEQKFDSIEELVRQLNRDKERCMRLLSKI